MIKEPGENLNNGEEPLKIIQELPTVEDESQAEMSTEEKVGVALEKQETQLSFREKNCDKKNLSGLKKWLGVAALVGSSLLAVGCGAEKPSNGFTDNAHQNVQQRLEQTKSQVKHMKEMKNYKPGAEAQKTSREMQDGNGFTDESGSGVQRPGNNVEQGPSGRVSNPEDL